MPPSSNPQLRNGVAGAPEAGNQAKTSLLRREAACRPAEREAELCNDEIFQQVRDRFGVPDNFVDKGYKFTDLAKGEGKGGGQMCFCGDFVVKELSKDDDRVLFELANSYWDHLSTGVTRLVIIFLHFKDIKTGRKFFVMGNTLGSRSRMDGSSLPSCKRLYDLKGCDDDKTLMYNGRMIKAVRKRIWNVHMWGGQCCWTPDRTTYYEGKVAARKLKLSVTGAQRERILEELSRDTAWLSEQNLMDYSLLVGVKVDKEGSFSQKNNSQILGEPLVMSNGDGTETALFVGVIDFLQVWNAKKKVAQCIKALETNKATVPPAPYAKRFYARFDDALQVIGDKP